MSDEQQRWWFCLKHMAVEPDAGCPGKDRLGPYPTREAAARAAGKALAGPAAAGGRYRKAQRPNQPERCVRVTEDQPGASLPPAAEARMAEIRGSGTWGSALSADEFAAIRSVGFEPVGQVLGAAVYNIG